MPRLNIYIPHELSRELRGYRDRLNVSEICAQALRSELEAITSLRIPMDRPFGEVHPDYWSIELQVARKYGLRRVKVGPDHGDTSDSRDSVGRALAGLLDSHAHDGLHMCVGGGSQIWAAVRALKPRNLRMHLSALGYGQVDHEQPHLHANALVTMLSLLYAPRSTVALIPDRSLAASIGTPAAGQDEVDRLIVGSCDPFSATSSYARRLGPEITEVLEENAVLGDYLGVFVTADGRTVEPYLPSADVSHIGSGDLVAQSKRDRSLVILAAAGPERVGLMRQILKLGLCNALITDSETLNSLT